MLARCEQKNGCTFDNPFFKRPIQNIGISFGAPILAGVPLALRETRRSDDYAATHGKFDGIVSEGDGSALWCRVNHAQYCRMPSSILTSGE